MKADIFQISLSRFAYHKKYIYTFLYKLICVERIFEKKNVKFERKLIVEIFIKYNYFTFNIKNIFILIFLGSGYNIICIKILCLLKTFNRLFSGYFSKKKLFLIIVATNSFPNLPFVQQIFLMVHFTSKIFKKFVIESKLYKKNTEYPNHFSQYLVQHQKNIKQTQFSRISQYIFKSHNP